MGSNGVIGIAAVIRLLSLAIRACFYDLVPVGCAQCAYSVAPRQVSGAQLHAQELMYHILTLVFGVTVSTIVAEIYHGRAVLAGIDVWVGAHELWLRFPMQLEPRFEQRVNDIYRIELRSARLGSVLSRFLMAASPESGPCDLQGS